MDKLNGFKKALAMLSGLSPGERESVLEKMAFKDPKMTEALKKNLITIEDLKLLSQKMLAELLGDIKLDDFALSLRIGSDVLKNYLLENVSKGNRESINEVLQGPPRARSDVEAASSRVMCVVREKYDKGELVFIDPEKDELV